MSKKATHNKVVLAGNNTNNTAPTDSLAGFTERSYWGSCPFEEPEISFQT